jgi:NTE family protein
MPLFRKRPSFGIAFSGGGARGIAELGAWKALEEEGVPFADMAAGTSAGSIVGACYALGMASGEIYEKALTLTESDFRNYTPPQGGAFGKRIKDIVANRSRVFALQRDSSTIEELCEGIFGEKTFADAKIPFFAVAVDLKSGTEADLATGKLARACRASSSVPGYFSPTEMGDMLLVDGSIANNLPADILRRYGMEVVLGIDVLNDKYTPPRSTGFVDVIGAYIEVASHNGKVKNRSLCTVLVSPELSKYPQRKIEKADEIYAAGYTAMKEKMPELKEALGMEAVRRPFGFFRPKAKKESKEKEAGPSEASEAERESE